MSTLGPLWDRLRPVRIDHLVRDESAVSIVHALRHRGVYEREQAEREVANWPINVASAILALDHRSAGIRIQAAEQLANAPINHYAVRAGLRRAVADRDPRVACEAANPLIEIGDVSALWPLLEIWDEVEIPERASRAAERLDTATIDQLLTHKAASEESDWALGFVLRAMAPRVAPHLAERSADQDRRVRLRALNALGSSGDPSQAGAAAACLKDRSKKTRRAALGALHGLGVGSPDVIALLSDPCDLVRRAAASLIGAVNIEGGYDALLARLKRETDESVRGAIVSAIAKVGGEDVIPLLTEALAEGTGGDHYRYPASASQAAANALRELGRPGIDVLLEKAADPDIVVRRAVLGEVGSLPRDHRVAQVLADALRDDGLYVTATDAFTGSSGPVPSGPSWYMLWNHTPVQASQDVLLPMLDDPASVIRIRACRALMSQEVLQVAERVRRLFAEDPDPEVRGQALRTLGAINAPGLRELTTPLLDEGDPMLAEHAKWAVEHADLVATVHRQQQRDPWATG